MEKTNPVAVIIGAGRTGRGFLARLIQASDYRIVFVDQSEPLVRRLTEDQAFSVHFSGKERKPARIEGYSACAAGSETALEAMASAELVFTAIGEHNLHTLVAPIRQALNVRKKLNRPGPLKVITCENGIAPGQVLWNALRQSPDLNAEDVLIAESAIFCTTVALEHTRLDILSETYDLLPYNAEVLSEELEIAGLVPVTQFPKLIQRKIYTYNCISACVAYLGAFKGYAIYADAANDSDIRQALEQLCIPLNKAISSQLQVEPDEQEKFSMRAIDKFSNRDILDYIERNAVDVARKLGPTERLIAPLRMIRECGGDYSVLALVIAAAMHYKDFQEILASKAPADRNPVTLLCEISGLAPQDEAVDKVCGLYAELEQARSSGHASLSGILHR